MPLVVVAGSIHVRGPRPVKTGTPCCRMSVAIQVWPHNNFTKDVGVTHSLVEQANIGLAAEFLDESRIIL